MSNLHEISASDALAGVQAGRIQLLDVRNPAEIEANGTAVGALCIPLSALRIKGDPNSPEFDPALTARPTLAVFCAVGARSAAATELLSGYGHDVRDLGTLRSWRDAGGATTQ
ncbi:rhodanese-like domain-containing protein [Pseudoprimorskyibacter insulae]|uniref:Rhodanese domain-containing protein n=1 Tax=Pseudoprimorskyibacter insulae TaxID=1695997 RepID=A0A2R8AWH8_9RHOB|nr:rhodanese-like domain-containing protein [Pseudoprimorskyibacter insulae]SPF80395.1 hypothetical protein PRI8871_02201 [Pseudoprimorskyibacter insulae]